MSIHMELSPDVRLEAYKKLFVELIEITPHLWMYSAARISIPVNRKKMKVFNVNLLSISFICGNLKRFKYEFKAV